MGTLSHHHVMGSAHRPLWDHLMPPASSIIQLQTKHGTQFCSYPEVVYFGERRRL
jgi:hypothetical protein